MDTFGFLINPVAGMGGSVGLKGTDGLMEEAVRRGASPVSPGRALRFLRALGVPRPHFLTCSGAMGEDIFLEAGIGEYSVVYRCGSESTAVDTERACLEFLNRDVPMIVFCGGDGTARDILRATSGKVLILGIPAGVKMYSGVFTLTPEAAAELVSRYREARVRDAEVLDVDEAAYRQDELRTRLFGIAPVPYLPGFVQAPKQVLESTEEDRAKAEIARFMVEVMEGTPGTLYLLGPGTTTLEIARTLGGEKTILGFDAFLGGRQVGRDLDERGILALAAAAMGTRIVVSPLGSQGSILGRGTQQISPEVLRRVGVGNVIVIATPSKLSGTPALFVDTGDPGLDRAFGESVRVITGYRIARRRRLRIPAGKKEIH